MQITVTECIGDAQILYYSVFAMLLEGYCITYFCQALDLNSFSAFAFYWRERIIMNDSAASVADVIDDSNIVNITTSNSLRDLVSGLTN